MLIIDHLADGSTIVRIKKDWHVGRLGSAIGRVHPPPSYERLNVNSRSPFGEVTRWYQEVILSDKMRATRERIKHKGVNK